MKDEDDSVITNILADCALVADVEQNSDGSLDQTDQIDDSASGTAADISPDVVLANDWMAIFRAVDKHRADVGGGAHDVVCPFAAVHTDAGGAYTATLIAQLPFADFSLFCCSDPSCATRDIFDVAAALSLEGVVFAEVADAAVLVVAGALAAAANDVGALFEQPVIGAAHWLSLHDLAMYERQVANLRASRRVRLSQWEGAVKRAAPPSPRRNPVQVTRSPTGGPVGGTPQPPANDPRFAVGDQVEIATELLKHVSQTACTQAMFAGQLFAYDEALGVYSPLAREALSSVVQSWSGAAVRTGEHWRRLAISAATVNGAIDLAIDRVTHNAGLKFFDSAPAGITCTNGFLRLDRPGHCVNLEPHKHEQKSRFALPVAFDSAATAPIFLRTLDEVFAGDPAAQDKISVLRQFIGVCLFGQATKYQQALVLLGEGSNGKSLIMRIVKALFPPGSVKAVAPQEFADDYKGAELSGALVNLVSEMPENDILNSSAVKAIISGDEITKRRIYERPFHFCPVAGHIFAANQLPAVQDHTRGFWRRFLVVTFPRVFSKEEADVSLADDIIANELSGVLAWAVQGIEEVLVAGQIVEPACCVEALAEWRTLTDSVAQFVEVCCLTKTAVWTQANVVFRRYQLWCHDNGMKPFQSRKFGIRLKLRVADKRSNGIHYNLKLCRDGEVPPSLPPVPSGPPVGTKLEPQAGDKSMIKQTSEGLEGLDGKAAIVGQAEHHEGVGRCRTADVEPLCRAAIPTLPSEANLDSYLMSEPSTDEPLPGGVVEQ